jgi:uncharacterized Zn finger protein
MRCPHCGAKGQTWQDVIVSICYHATFQCGTTGGYYVNRDGVIVKARTYMRPPCYRASIRQMNERRKAA